MPDGVAAMLKVLVVDDSRTMRMATRVLMERLGMDGFEVVREMRTLCGTDVSAPP